MNRKLDKLYQLKEELLKDIITYSQAYEQIKKLPKSWTTSEWKKERNKLIKNRCEQCGSTEGIMVLQHLKQPDSFALIRNQIVSKLFNEYLKVNPIYLTEEEFLTFVQENHEVRKGCPKCRKISLMERKKSFPKYQ